MVRCRIEPTRWPLNNHLTSLNPDVPDFQPGKIWKNENQSINNEIHVSEKEATMNWKHVSTKRKKPTKKKV
jgi:hypothetical protein